MPRISVIMPARNAEATIRPAVTSTLRALPTDAELVVLDDASTDGTAAALATIRDPRLRVDASEAQLGVGTALGRLLATTDSEFVARMDADDVTLPGRFRIEQLALAGADAVFSTVLEHRGGRLRIPSVPSRISPREFPYRLLVGNPVAHSTLMARRSTLERAGGYRAVPSEDYDLWLRLATHGARIRRIAAPTIVYRVHSGQQTDVAGWQLSSWHDERTNAAFADLSRALLGESYGRLTTLAMTASHSDFDAELQRFQWAFMAAASAALPARTARALQSRLARRLRYVRGLREASHVDA